jgi:pimeloyl-ACP methyl ester carboxylesterase
MNLRPSPVHPLREPAADRHGARLVLVHGMEDDWRSWIPLVDLLDPALRVTAVDLPWRAGNGYRWRRSGTPGAWLAAALRQLPEPPDILIGHSLGANAVLEMLATEPAPAPRGAILVAPFYCPPGIEITWRVFERARRGFEQIIREGMWVRLGRRAQPVDAELAETILAKMIERIGPVGFTTLFDQFVATADLPLAEVTVPTLVVGSHTDPSLAGGRAAALGNAMPAAEVVLEAGFDHFCHVQQVDELAGHLSRFIEKVCAEEPA